MPPALSIESLKPTRDYLRDVALALGALQRGFLTEHSRLWEHGLEVTMRGISTQAFEIGGQERRASIDLVRSTTRFSDAAWPLEQFSGPDIFKQFRSWLELNGIKTDLEAPGFAKAQLFEPEQSKLYAEVLWWMEEQFRKFKSTLKEGVVSPILLYPHHFDLAMSWFPWDDERQMTLGWSTGDEHVAEPYVYITAYPEQHGMLDAELPADSHWQQDGFNGVIMLYDKLRSHKDPEASLRNLAELLFAKGRNQLA